MNSPRRVDDAYPVVKQWSFVAYERTLALGEAIQEFFAARRALSDARSSTPFESWATSTHHESRRYEESIYRLQGAQFFLVSAASHVVRALDADADLDKLPGGLHRQLHQARNVLEHWDEWTEEETKWKSPTSAARFRSDNPDVWPFGFKFTEDDFAVAGVIPLGQLHDALEALWLWLTTPPPERTYPPAPPGTVQYDYPLEK